MVVENKAERQSIGFQANRGSRVSNHTVCFVSHFTTAGGGGNSHTRLLRIRSYVKGGGTNYEERRENKERCKRQGWFVHFIEGGLKAVWAMAKYLRRFFIIVPAL